MSNIPKNKNTTCEKLRKNYFYLIRKTGEDLFDLGLYKCKAKSVSIDHVIQSMLYDGLLSRRGKNIMIQF
jgi:hypothetical protein